MRKIALLAPLAAVAMSMTGLAAASAEPAAVAGNQNGVCDNLEACFYYNSNYKGSVADFENRVSDFAGYRFLGAGNGKGQAVKNNAASVCNNAGRYTVRVYFNSGFDGVHDDIPPRSCRNLTRTYNENASFEWLVV